MDREQRARISVTVESAIELLNGALSRDREAVEALMHFKVVCNRALADHPTIVVADENGDGSLYSIGPLSLINGFFGLDEEEWGHIAALADPVTGRLLRFELTRDTPL